jgi:hypothetical protein
MLVEMHLEQWELTASTWVVHDYAFMAVMMRTMNG